MWVSENPFLWKLSFCITTKKKLFLFSARNYSSVRQDEPLSCVGMPLDYKNPGMPGSKFRSTITLCNLSSLIFVDCFLLCWGKKEVQAKFTWIFLSKGGRGDGVSVWKFHGALKNPNFPQWIVQWLLWRHIKTRKITLIWWILVYKEDSQVVKITSP